MVRPSVRNRRGITRLPAGRKGGGCSLRMRAEHLSSATVFGGENGSRENEEDAGVGLGHVRNL